MNVYVVETSRRLAEAGVEVEIFTRATRSKLPCTVELAPGVLVRHIIAGPLAGLSKEDLPGQLCQFTTGVLRAGAAAPPGWYDLIHSHYWMSGQVGCGVKERWGIPLVHTAHTLARVKNHMLAKGDSPEPAVRVAGEDQLACDADHMVANTPTEARELLRFYDVGSEKVSVVPPGVDLERFAPVAGGKRTARRRLGLPRDASIVAFVGRIQPLKAPDVLLRAAARLRDSDPRLGRNLVVVICGGPSGSGLERPTALMELAQQLDLGDMVRFIPPLSQERLAQLYRAVDLIAVPSHNESFGLVALEAQACGTPVVAAAVGGLVTAVRDGISGILVDSHRTDDWARALGGLLRSPGYREKLSIGAVEHAERFSWSNTAAGLLGTYRSVLATHLRRRQMVGAGCCGM